MGKTTRWFKSLLGFKKEKEHRDTPNTSERKEKKRWSFAQSGRDSSDVGEIQGSIPGDIPAAEAAWLRSYYSNETDKEQNKQAIAVAAATAAAADAAVAAAQAAVAVVRLTSHGRGTMFGGARERWAAVKIQTVFRGFLARKALRALKGLVKLQAHVRGYLVRRQAAATLHSMQALIRAQATVRLHKSQSRGSTKREQREIQPRRRSIERFDESRSEHPASIHSRRLSVSAENFDESPKIVEIDTCRPKSRSRRTNTSVSDFGEDPYPMPSPLPGQMMPSRLSIPEGRHFQDSDWGYTGGDECRFSTAQSTPRFKNSIASNAPLTPAKSVCGEGLFRRYSNFPNYMANTQSFRAKVRSQSAPKQRPEPAPKKRLSLNEMVEARASLSGVRMQKSCSQAQDIINFKNTVMGKFDRHVESGREEETDYLERRW